MQGEKEIFSINSTSIYWLRTLSQWAYNGKQKKVKVLSLRRLGLIGETY